MRISTGPPVSHLFQNIISEPILESLIQAHIILFIWGSNYDILFEPPWNYSKYSDSGFFGSGPFFILTFTLSGLSAAKGLAGFLLHGPCKLLPTTEKFDGMGSVGYLLLFLNIVITMVAKGFVLMPGTCSFLRFLCPSTSGWANLNSHFLPQRN